MMAEILVNMHLHVFLAIVILLAGAADSAGPSISEFSPSVPLGNGAKHEMSFESAVKPLNPMTNRNKSSVALRNEKSEIFFENGNKPMMASQNGVKSENLAIDKNKFAVSSEDRVNKSEKSLVDENKPIIPMEDEFKSVIFSESQNLSLFFTSDAKTVMPSEDKFKTLAPVTNGTNLTKILARDSNSMNLSVDKVKSLISTPNRDNLTKSFLHDVKPMMPSEDRIMIFMPKANGTNFTKPFVHEAKSIMASSDRIKSLISMANRTNLTMPLVHSAKSDIASDNKFKTLGRGANLTKPLMHDANSEMASEDRTKVMIPIAGRSNLTMPSEHGAKPSMDTIKSLTTIADGANLTMPNANNECKSEKISCLCRSESKEYILPIEVKMYLVKDNVTGVVKCKGTRKPSEICADHHCHFPSHQVSSLQKNGTGGKLMDSLISPFYPIEFKVPRESLYEHPRYARQSEPCHVQPLKNAEIKCWKWPNWINCDITCIHGYGLRLDKGVATKTNINCRLSENRWKPRGFQDCQPYINCKAHLVMPGDLVCKEPLHSPAYCEISCLEYDQYDAVNSNKYECKNETFSRILPHCARLDDDVDLIGKPS